MRQIPLILLPVLLIAPAEATRAHAPHKAHTHQTRRAKRPKGSWDPGYTYNNPFGLPPYVRRPPR